jgi:hypothetical protein
MELYFFIANGLFSLTDLIYTTFENNHETFGSPKVT